MNCHVFVAAAFEFAPAAPPRIGFCRMHTSGFALLYAPFVTPDPDPGP